MKQHKLIPLILTVLLAFVSYVKAVPLQYLDSDAETYIASRAITSPVTKTRINQLVSALKNANLWTSLTHFSVLLPDYGAVSGSTVAPLVGTAGTIVGNLPISQDGAVFDGAGTSYIWITNPLGNPVASYSIAIGFKSVQNGGYQFVFGGNDWNNNFRGPQIFAHGNPSSGYAPGNIYNYRSALGTTSPSGWPSSPGYARGRAITEGNQIAIATFSNTRISVRNGMDVYAYTDDAGYGTSYNGRTRWHVGVGDGISLVALQGSVAFYAVANRNWTQNETDLFRRIVTKTIGIGYLHPYEFIFEGDSLTAAGVIGTEVAYSTQLMTNATWNTKATSANVATTGHKTTDVETSFATDIETYAEDVEFSTVYLSLFIGANDVSVTEDANVIFNRIQNMWYRSKQMGFKVIKYTVPLTSSISASASQTQTWEALNRLIRNSGGADYLIDVARLPQLTDNANRTYYHTDGVHFTSLGHNVIANEIVKQINLQP